MIQRVEAHDMKDVECGAVNTHWDSTHPYPRRGEELPEGKEV